MIYRVGVDGGGTKTEAILVDEHGQEIARRTGPGCNPSIVGSDQARGVVAEVLRALLEPQTHRDPGFRIERTLLCMAGSRGHWSEFAAALTTFGRATAVDDSLPVLELATNGGRGVVLHAGTGSFVAARARNTPADPFGDVSYAGGLGWRFGDAGSGYDLGRQAVARGLLELQGWLPLSGVGRFLKETTGLPDAAAISRYFYNDSVSNPKVSGLAPGILELVAQGDPVARDLALKSTSELLELAVIVVNKLFAEVPLAEVPVGLSGPILNQPQIREALAERSPLRLTPITAAPIEGVKRLLARI